VLALIEASLADDKVIDATVIDMTGKSTIADFMVIASGASQRQIGAIADHLMVKLKSMRTPKLSVEGRSRSDWVLIDAGDVIVHLFRPEVRAFYNLEKMWGLELPESATSTAGLTAAATV
jgi:ribosome-associated protein